MRLISLFAAGMIATACMSLLMEMLPHVGFPHVDVPLIIAETLFGPTYPKSPAHIAGWVLHFALGGAVFPLGLYLFVERYWPLGSAAMKGWLLGMALFLGGEGIAIPLSGGGFFSSEAQQPGLVVLQDFLAHTVYGVLLGWMAKPILGAAKPSAEAASR